MGLAWFGMVVVREIADGSTYAHWPPLGPYLQLVVRRLRHPGYGLRLGLLRAPRLCFILCSSYGAVDAIVIARGCVPCEPR
jgi:hypothetical protein